MNIEHVAVHEAGHLVMARMQGIQVTKATIVPAEDYAGFVERGADRILRQIDVRWDHEVIGRAMAAIRVCFGGEYATKIWKPRAFRLWQVEKDHHIAADLILRLAGEDQEEQKLLVKYLSYQTRTWLENNWDFVLWTAELLMEHNTLNRNQCKTLRHDYYRKVILPKTKKELGKKDDCQIETVV